MHPRTALLGGLGAAAAAGGAFLAVAATNGEAPQPVPFSHAHHAGVLGIDCRHCHYLAERSAWAGVPAMETCMGCHYPVVARPRVEPLRWRRTVALQAFAYFDHSIHLAAGVGCSTCHGRVDRMDRVVSPQRMTMRWCLDCHRDPSPHLRPPGAIADMDWVPSAEQDRLGRQRMRARGIDPDRLTHCHACHR